VANPLLSDPRAVIGILKRPLTTAELDRVDALSDAVVATLELHLNRWLFQRRVYAEKHRTGTQGRIVLYHEPVAWIDALHYGSASAASVAFDEDGVWEEPGAFPAGTTVWVDYTAGDDYPEVAWAGAATDLIANVVARTLALPGQVATGALKSYSVEGTSITYATPDAPGNKGRLTVGDLGTLARLRVPVVL